MFVILTTGNMVLKKQRLNDERDIPIPAVTSGYLQKLCKRIDSGFIFSVSSGVRPVYHKDLLEGFYKALENIGIQEAGKKGKEYHFSFMEALF